jgi:hypothetical protein
MPLARWSGGPPDHSFVLYRFAADRSSPVRSGPWAAKRWVAVGAGDGSRLARELLQRYRGRLVRITRRGDGPDVVGVLERLSEDGYFVIRRHEWSIDAVHRTDLATIEALDEEPER